MGAPLELSAIETEQPIPLAVLSPDGRTASCVTIKLHWAPKAAVAEGDDATSFTLDLPANDPGAPIFTAQLWNASLASAGAWQQPWLGAAWQVAQVPATDGSGLDAALAVGMISTSARRPYPKETLVIGSLNPDGSLGAVSKLVERMDAAAGAGIKRIIIPGVQRFDTDASGQVINIMKHADDLHVECVPADNLVDATEAVMHDPLPDLTVDNQAPRYGKDVVDYIDDFARREQTEATSGLEYGPKESELPRYPANQAAIWKSVYADIDMAQQAYRGGQVYVAYQLFARANGRMHGATALSGQNRVSFDVKAALAQADSLHQRLHDLMNPPTIDKGDLSSALLIAEMADWAYDIRASLEGAELVTKQAFSQRSDATDAERDRAREAILFANEEANYRLDEANFYTGLLAHLADNSSAPVEENAAHLLPQLIPAQLATAQVFTEGIRPRAGDLREGLLFDPRLVAYVNVLRESKASWDARVRRKEVEAANTPAGVVRPNNAPSAAVEFDPGNTYAPPHTLVVAASGEKKLSDVARCLIWVNDDCEIATLDEKYLRLSGSIDPATHAWHVKDRARLDALLQDAESGSRRGLALAEKAGLDSSVLAMIYERASQLRAQGDESAGLEALRNYWRCALLGNMCWQLAHTRKAEVVDLSAEGGKDAKVAKDGDKKPETKDDGKKPDKTNVATTTNAAPATPVAPVKVVDIPTPAPATNPAPVNPGPPVAQAVPVAPEAAVPVAPIAQDSNVAPPRALPVTDANGPAPETNTVANVVPPITPPAATPAAPDPDNIPVARVAKPEDLGADTTPAQPVTNAPIVGPMPPAAN